MEIENVKFDYAILGEVLEHVDNPVLFIASIIDSYRENIDRLIITVPNAFSSWHNKMAKKGIECINSDHRYVFTPYTLTKVLNEAGMEVEEIVFADPNLNIIEKIYRKITSRTACKRPWLSRTLVCVCKPK